MLLVGLVAWIAVAILDSKSFSVAVIPASLVPWLLMLVARLASVRAAAPLVEAAVTALVRAFSGVARLIANHPHLSIFESAPEVRVLSSTGITRLQQSYDPVRLPSVPPPVATLRPLPSPVTGLPRLPEPPFRRAVLTTPADRAGARVDCFPAHAAFPKWPEGRHPHCHFRDAMGRRRGLLHPSALM